MSLLDTLLQRPVIIALAVAGALIATFGSYQKARKGPSTQSQRLIRFGYAITALSMILFIVAGFRSAYI